MTFDDFEEEVCNFEDGCSGWERFLPICKDYAYQLYDENQALQQHIKELESFEERSCMRCKNVNDCSLCENVKDDTGMKLREMSFFCFQKRD